MEPAIVIQTLLIAAAVVAPLLTAAWIGELGLTRGLAAGLCRVGWIAPLFLALFPETTSEQLPRTMSLRPVQVLVDDSASMAALDGESSASTKGAAPSLSQPEPVRDLLERIDSDCARLGCIPKVTRLSELGPETANGYTPLGRVLEPWLYKAGVDPWIVISDGGDAQPREAWSAGLRNAGRSGRPGEPTRGMIVGYKGDDRANVWIAAADVPPFSFEDKPLVVDVRLERNGSRATTERVQLQVIGGSGEALATVNAAFQPSELETRATATLPPLPRGQHLLTLRALPTADEFALWDNMVHAPVEVLPNTVGVLHLLGSPSWDGRFLRRYLKAEPKYDLISFFILRDPWDSQQVNERELSLIPFPVERLFKEELPNFRVVVLQNFTLFQFLLPEYQENLVRFVQEGGGLLFVGGPRALQPSDLSNSPLAEILPFDLGPGAAPPNQFAPMLDALTDDFGDGAAAADPNGPSYDEGVKFKVELARPSPEKRALANVFDDWEQLQAELTAWDNAQGLHHMERVKFKADVTTQLLTAKTAQGTEIPLAVASYPGKGRAIWLFSDSLWRLAMSMREDTSRQAYNKFFEAAMTWLMRQELRKALVATGFTLRGPASTGRFGEWRATLQGSALRYLQGGGSGADWQVRICGRGAAAADLSMRKTGSEEIELAGELGGPLAGGERCLLEVEARHPAFGSVKANVTGVMPETYKDEELGGAPQKLADLAKLTGAVLSMPPDPPQEAVGAWLERITGQEGVALPNRFRTTQNHFWVLDRPWFWVLLLLMPLEVLIRRWEQLTGRTRASTGAQAGTQ